MKKSIFFIVLDIFILLLPGFCSGQKSDSRDLFKIVFYNCENLYDTIDDPRKNDNEFLPSSKKNWTSERYETKIKNIAHVIYAADSINLPDIIGLCEIENINVLDDLINSTYLKNGNYQIVHYESTDVRGIDVALLCDTSIVNVLYSRPIPVYNSGRKMREILFVKATIRGADTLNIFINHWKSRAGGVSETEGKRDLYASVVKKNTDSLFTKNPKANIIIMGDLNDEPADTSVSMTLNALLPSEKPGSKSLYNLFYGFYNAQKGSYYYKDDKKWNMFDQIIISGNLLSSQKNKLHYIEGSAEIFRKNWMLYKSSSGEMLPSKTYDGSRYHAGFSDHLPVTIQLGKQNK